MKQLILLICSSFFCLSLWASNEGRGGGNPIAAEFVKAGEEAFQDIEKRKNDFPEVNLTLFRKILDHTKVFIVGQIDGTFLGQTPQVELSAAFDIFKNEIYVSKNWDKYSHDMKKVLAFHEYLGLMGVEKNTYPVSSRLIRQESTLNLPKMTTEQIQENDCKILPLKQYSSMEREIKGSQLVGVAAAAEIEKYFSKPPTNSYYFNYSMDSNQVTIDFFKKIRARSFDLVTSLQKNGPAIECDSWSGAAIHRRCSVGDDPLKAECISVCHQFHNNYVDCR